MQLLLDDAHTIGDPCADRLIARLSKRGDLGAIDRAIGTLKDHSSELRANVPSGLRRFFKAEGMPAWADRARILRAQRWIAQHPIATATALFCAALPTAFTGAKGVAVLYATGRLSNDVDRRVNETGRFVFDVLMPGSFESGRAVRSTQKVRLLHAVVRHRVRAGSRRGRRANLPINQEELLGTLTCFSIVVLDAFVRMGIPVREEDAADYLHLWCVVGAMLGIREDWLPGKLSTARALASEIRARQGGTTAEGRALAAILLDGIERHLPARGLRVLGPGLMRLFLDEGTTRSLALPQGLLYRDLQQLLGLVSRRLTGVATAVLPTLGRSLLEAAMQFKLGGREASFHTPLATLRTPTTAARCPYDRGSA